MADLEDFTDQGTPLLTDLNAAAPALGRLIEAQGTLADASRESFPSLGDALERGRPALIEARPLIRDLGELGQEAAPVAVNLDDLTKSLNKTGAIERLNDLIYYITLVSNGFDGLGHYLRAGLVTNVCSTYALEPSPACRSTFYDPRRDVVGAAPGSRPRTRTRASRRARAACRPPAPCSRTCSDRATRASISSASRTSRRCASAPSSGTLAGARRLRAGARLPAGG